MTPAVRAHDVFCLYPTPRGQVAALRGLTLDVAPGERVVVHGPNGSGKTTLLRVLAGEQAVGAGSVTVAGVDLAGADERARAQLRARLLGYVDQHHGRTLRPELTVRDNVGLQLRLAGAGAARSRARAEELLAELGLGELTDRLPQTLSGGESQRVAVCAALAHRPEVVLADEPTGELDRASADAVYDLLVRATTASGAALVLVSHDIHAARVAERVVRIRDGRLSEQWHPDDLAADGETLVVDDRGWVRLPEPLRRRLSIGSGVRAGTVGPDLVLSADGSPAPTAPPPPVLPPVLPSGAGEPPMPVAGGNGSRSVATLRGVCAARGGRAVLVDLDLDLAPGQLTVVRGPSGSGKSTLLRILAGLERPDAGTVCVAGRDLASLDRAQLAGLRRDAVGVSGQAASLVEAIDVRENLELVSDVRGLVRDPARSQAWLEAFGLSSLSEREVRVLSGGERQRVSVARTLAAGPALALLDEPTSQQDEASAERLVAVLLAAARSGIAVVAATHDPVLVASADSVVTLG